MGEILYDEVARVESRRKAEHWLVRQAARLDTTPQVILKAIRERAWLPEQIVKVTSRYALEGKPPPLEGVPDWIDARIKAQTGPTTLAVALYKARAA